MVSVSVFLGKERLDEGERGSEGIPCVIHRTSWEAHLDCRKKIFLLIAWRVDGVGSRSSTHSSKPLQPPLPPSTPHKPTASAQASCILPPPLPLLMNVYVAVHYCSLQCYRTSRGWSPGGLCNIINVIQQRGRGGGVFSLTQANTASQSPLIYQSNGSAFTRATFSQGC